MAGYGHEPRRFRRLYSGLLNAYLTLEHDRVDPEHAEGTGGVEVLRQFLEGSLDICLAATPLLEWTEVLASHREVLSSDPGRRYAAGLLAGDSSDLEVVCAGLGLTGGSWLPAEAVRAATQTAIKKDDAAFQDLIPVLLDAVAEPRFQSLRDETLAVLLRRYGDIESPSVHSQLRDTSVAWWKNPWLERNGSAWGRVSDKVRSMVTGWLKLELIHQFFEVLAEDGRQDKDRFEFWRDYHEQMEDVYFALGRKAMNSRHADMQHLRSALDGRLLRLTDAPADNNAFIMCFRNALIVEFSKTGNAAFRYGRGDLALDNKPGVISMNELKRDSTHRLIHRHGGGKSWQQQFRAKLKEDGLGGHPDQTASYAATTKPHTTASGDSSTGSTATTIDYEKWAKTNSIAVADHRPMGGSLWLKIDNADPDISRQLSVWDFKFKPGKGWWRSGP